MGKIYSLQEIGEKLKKARQEKKISQRELAAKVGLPQSHISKIERGQVDLQTSSLIQCARALELELMLIPRSLVPICQSLIRTAATGTTTQVPLYRGDEESDE